MPEASPDPTPTTPPPPPPAPRPPQRDIEPRRFGLTAIGIILGALLLIVLTIALLAGGGSSPLLESLGVSGDVRGVLYGFINALYFIAGIVAIIGLLVGGFRTATALGDARETRRGRRTLAISGGVILFLILSYAAVYRLIGPASEPPPRLSIVTTPAEAVGSAPFKLRFQARSNYPSTALYTWDFGDGGVQTAPDLVHEYLKAGDYTATVVVIVEGKEVDRAQRRVLVDASNPEARIVTEPLDATGPAPFALTFDASSSRPGFGAGPALSYAWDFGDSAASAENPNTAEGARATHRYLREGTFTVTLTVTDEQKKTGRATKEIVIAPPVQDPTARIVAAGLHDADSPDTLPYLEGLIPLTVSFSGASSESPNGDIVEYAWDFGDGEQGKGRSATHVYRTAATRTVTLRVTDSDGKSGSTRVEVRALPPQKAPIAKIETTPASNNEAIIGTAPFTLKLSGAGSTDEDGRVTAWRWELGEGITADGEQVERVYAKEGTYAVTLVATDDRGNASAPAKLSVKVVPAPRKAPSAVIAVTPDPPQGPRPLLVQFDASGSTGTAIVNYRWDFGDGTPVVSAASAREPHMYEKAGVFTVRLTVTDSAGQSGDASLTVSVRDPAIRAVIETDRLVAGRGEPVSFKGGASVGTVTKWFWDFGDGSTALGREVQHAFAAQGFYDVRLVVTDASNRTDQTTVRIEIH